MDNSVSIIVPCYNSELTIEKCALSILKNIENTDNHPPKHDAACR